MHLKLNNIELKGYKSVNGRGQTLPINDDITVLIGANGVGKSNIVSFFQLLNYYIQFCEKNQVFFEKCLSFHKLHRTMLLILLSRP